LWTRAPWTAMVVRAEGRAGFGLWALGFGRVIREPKA
jgi:hypothetical protein